MSPTGVASPQQPTVALRHRRNVLRMTEGQLADFRGAVAAAQELSDERGYQWLAGLHGLPLPMYCKHGSPIFLAWHRAYLYFFEKALQDRVAGVTLPWWDWSRSEIPAAYADEATADGDPNPLHSSPIPDEVVQLGFADRTERDPGAPGAPPLPAPEDVDDVIKLNDFVDFQTRLEDIHNGIHVWVGGTMSQVPVAAYDPIFWAHHCMIDRIWRLWQLRHPTAGPPPALLHQALEPFPMTVADTLSTAVLGYEYASSTSAASGPA